MKIAFIEPFISSVEPLGIGYLAEMLLRNNHKVRYFEAPRRYFHKRLLEFNPDILAYSTTTGKHRICRELNEFLRKDIKAISIAGGPHCSFFPEYIESSNLIDAICLGEGEDALVEFVNKLEQDKDYRYTENWWIRKNGMIYKNPVREKIKDLDTIPFPNREIIYQENVDLKNIPIKRIVGARGCPFNCSYCFNERYNSLYKGKGQVYRQRHPLNIIDEINSIKKYPFTFLKFVEDIFGMGMDLDKFKSEMPFLCNIRAGSFDRDRIKKLKKSGCVAVGLGIESANEFIRNKVLNRNLKLETLENTLKFLKEEKIRIWSQNIIGNPDETFDMAMETFRLNVKYKPDFSECFLLTPYPGTSVYKYCVERNYFDGKIDTLSKSYWLTSSLKFKTDKEKNRFVNFHKFFSFGVRHPKFLPIIKFLIKLPPNKIYIAFNRLYDSWRISKVAKAKFTFKNYLVAIRCNLRNIISYFLKEN